MPYKLVESKVFKNILKKILKQFPRSADDIQFKIQNLKASLPGDRCTLYSPNDMRKARLELKKYKKATRLMTLLVVLILIIAVFPVGDVLLSPLEKRFPSPGHLPDNVDGIILLGGAERVQQSFLWQKVELNKSSERFFEFLRLVKKYPHAQHVFTSGSGDIAFQNYKGAQVAKMLFKEQGLDTSKIIFESQSRNTYENAVFTRRLIEPKSGENWVLITSAAHMPRSMGVFSPGLWI